MTIEGNPWFVAADVCKALGFYLKPTGKANPSAMTSFIDADERCLNNVGTFNGPRMLLLSESGLYKVILRAERTRPEVIAFQDWVTKEVLPSIRKTGSFVTGQPSLVENPQMSKTALAGQLAASRRAFQNARVRSILTALVVQ